MHLEIINFIKKLYPKKNEIHLHEPILGNLEKDYLIKAIDSGFVSSAGPFVERFEQDFSNLIGSAFTIATVNGTSALHLALILAGVEAQDLVITQNLTFVATANAIRYCHADPVFIDVSEETLGLCPQALARFLKEECDLDGGYCIHKSSQRKIKACLPMHTFGLPIQFDEISELCKKYQLILIEDAAESLGSKYHSKMTGTLGTMGIFSFNGNKIVTSGGGGCLVTQHENLAKQAKHLSTTAKVYSPLEFTHDKVGFNYRMPNINAALLLAQLEQFNDFLMKKRAITEKYQSFFENSPYKLIQEPQHCTSNYWLNAILMHDQNEKNDFLKLCMENQIHARPCWTPMTQLPIYKNAISDSGHNSNLLFQKIVNLPSGVDS